MTEVNPTFIAISETNLKPNFIANIDIAGFNFVHNPSQTNLWRFRCQRLPAPALISPLIDYVPRWIAFLCLVVCIASRCQIVSSFVPGGCCVALQMLMRAGVLSWIKPGERFCSSLGSVMTIYTTKKWINNCFALESCVSNREHLMLAAHLHSGWGLQRTLLTVYENCAETATQKLIGSVSFS